jgi:uncharacterized membrane protein YdjX (TVP38/TMEM64 family)
VKAVKSKLLRIALLAALAAAIAVAVGYRELLDVASLESSVRSAGVAAPLLFMVIYILATVLFVPGSVLTITGGALFGPVWGTFYNLTAATIGATIAFLISRYLFSDWVVDKTGRRTQQLINGVEAEGWRFVAFVRLVPLFPFNLLNYALGVTRINTWHYVMASYVAMLPGAIAYTYLGYVGREAIGGGEGLIRKGMLGLALLATIALLPKLIGRLLIGATITADELSQRIDSGERLLVLDVRTAADFVGEQGHIDQAVNVPLETLADRLDEISEYQDRPVLIVSRTDRRSAKAAQLLSRNGFAYTHVVRGGMAMWLNTGHRVEGKSRDAEERQEC